MDPTAATPDAPVVVGIDVSKDRLDVAVRPTGEVFSIGRDAAGLDALIAREGELKGTLSGRSIAITEPVPLYMTDALGLTDATPEAFSEAVEEGTDVPATTLQETLALFSGEAVDALIYNEQTEGAQTDAVLDAAKAAGIPAVPVTETLPEGDDYTGWMTANLDAIEGALSQ